MNLLHRIGLVLAMTFLASGCAGTTSVGAAPAPASPAIPETRPSSPSEASAKFQAFLLSFRAEAQKAGIADATYTKAIEGLTLNPRVKELNESQPEFVRPVWEYLAGAISEYRVSKGRELIVSNAALFTRLEQTYGVPRNVIAAIWGMESSYGQNTGTLNLFQSLATLGYDGPRQSYGRSQFIAALKLAELEKLDPKAMTGSWAGAIGHTQFIPTTYLAHAVDGDGDGKRDLWNSSADALASTGAYLKNSGWNPSENWGEEVRLPEKFPYEDADPDIRKPQSAWAQMGVRGVTGGALKTDGAEGADETAIFLPAGHRGPAFLLRENFGAILKYNAATSYALAIGVLSDRLKGHAGVIGTWPRDEQPLRKDQRVALQEGLTALGHNTNGIDGVLGRQTRAALRAYQKSRGIPADGFATSSILTRILNERGALPR